MTRRGRRITAIVGFGLLALVVELTGRSIIVRLDRVLHVAPLATPTDSLYPFALACVRALAAVAVAIIAWRIVKVRSTASAGGRLLGGLGHRPREVPRLRLSLSPRLWLASFIATTVWFLIQNDAGRISNGSWPLLGPWLHTYALPVFALLSALLALAWGAVRTWFVEVESYVEETYRHARTLLRLRAVSRRRARPSGDRAPRHLFGLAFESRPPPCAI